MQISRRVSQHLHLHQSPSGTSILEMEHGSIPICFFRPTIVIAAKKEPYPGWIDNLNGPTGLQLNLKYL